MFFEYLKTSQYQDSIEIEDIGNCILMSLNDVADCWVLFISTELGYCSVVQAGPMNIDLDEVSPNVYLSKISFEYNEKRIHKIIHEFINNPKRIITSVQEIPEDECKLIIKKICNSICTWLFKCYNKHKGDN